MEYQRPILRRNIRVMVTKDRHKKPGLEQKKTSELTDNEKLSLELTEKSLRCNLKATQ